MKILKKQRIKIISIQQVIDAEDEETFQLVKNRRKIVNNQQDNDEILQED